MKNSEFGMQNLECGGGRAQIAPAIVLPSGFGNKRLNRFFRLRFAANPPPSRREAKLLALRRGATVFAP